MGIGAATSVLTVNNGTATLPTLNFNNTTGTLSLNGGTLALNGFTFSFGLNTIRFNGGTLQARVANPNFMPNVGLSVAGTSNLTANVQALGAVIDTNNVNITIAEPLLEDPASTGGGITKKSAGILTLGAPSTTTGAAVVEAGGLGVTAGAASWTPSSFTHSGDTLNVNLGVYNPLNPALIATGALTLNGPISVNLSGSVFQVGQVPLITYTSKPGSGSLAINPATLPAGVLATIVDNGAGLIYLDVTQAATVFSWNGDTNLDGSGEWDLATSNWNGNTVPYSEANSTLAIFPDIAGGGLVSLVTNVSPINIAFSNLSGNPYTFEGTGLITGATTVTKDGTGIVTFNGGAHSYSGAVAINAGAVKKQAADATSGNITVANNATFVLDGGVSDGAGQTLTLTGPGSLTANYFFTGSAAQRGALQAQFGANTWSGDIVLTPDNTNMRIGVQDGSSLTLNGSITESAPGVAPLFRLGGPGDDITLNGVGSWTGVTQMFSLGGKLILGGDDRLPTNAPFSQAFGSSPVPTNILDLAGFDQTVAGLRNGQGRITNSGASASVLTSAPIAATTSFYYGVIEDGDSPISFVKSGDGIQQLAASNTYSGTTTVTAGRLEITENQQGTGDVIVNGGNLKLSFNRNLASGVNLSIASGAFFYPDGSSQTLGKLEGQGTVDFTFVDAGTDTLSVGSGDVSSTFDGVIQQSTARRHALRKIGTGTFTLTGLNTYTGNTTVEDGILSVAQSNFADTSTVTIGSVAASPAVLNLPNAGTDLVTELVIDGVIQPAGVVYDSSNSGGAITGIGKIEVIQSDPFVGWIDAFFTGETNPAVIGKTADPDNDGVNNLTEFALNGNPADGSNNGLTALLVQDASAPAGNELTLVAAVRDGAVFAGSPSPAATLDGVTYTAEGSLDLVFPGSAVSVSAASNTAPAATGLPDLTGSSWEYRTFKLDASEGLTGKGFLRLKID
jgi:autotransporter-associated beta strand protein